MVREFPRYRFLMNRLNQLRLSLGIGFVYLEIFPVVILGIASNDSYDGGNN